jgi:hypothetical protein
LSPENITRCCGKQVRLLRRAGERDHARDQLIAATTLYREMDMRFWLRQAEAEREVHP